MLPDDTTVLAGESAGMAGSIAAALGTLAPAPAAAPLALTGGTTVLASDCCGSAVDCLLLAYALAIAVSELTGV